MEPPTATGPRASHVHPPPPQPQAGYRMLACLCAQGDSNSHPAYAGQGPQPWEFAARNVRCVQGVRFVTNLDISVIRPRAGLEEEHLERAGATNCGACS